MAMTPSDDRDGSDRHGRCSTQTISADRPRRSAVVPGAPIAGMSCFAIDAPAWNEAMATTRLTMAAAVDLEAGTATDRNGGCGELYEEAAPTLALRNRIEHECDD